MKFNHLIPEFSVSNIEISKRFYLQIGFQVAYERKEDKFVFLKLEENQIMIEEVNDNWNVGIMEYPFGRGINISMEVSNVDELYHHILKEKIKVFRELKIDEYRVGDKLYQDKEFLVQDPDGYLLRFHD